VEELSGDELEYDVFLSFTRSSPGAWDRTTLIADALEKRGLRVFRDERIDEFDGITAGLVRALASSKVLLAYYTREFPGRYACQWELTAAFVAAQREGDPRRRVLVVNPAGGDDHLMPVELADARYALADTEPDVARLVVRVAERVAAVRGPLGAPPHVVDRARLPAEVLRPERFVGRYRQLWEIHSAVHGMDLPGVHEPAPEPAVLVSGLTGAGKSSLVARYAYLYRDAYPGGVFWTGPFGGDPASVPGRFADELHAVAAELGLPVEGVGPARLRRMVANKLREAEHPVLWIVDDVPPGLTREQLNGLLIPARNVRTIVTSRAAAPDWDARQVDVSGLGADEAVALFGHVLGAPLSREEKETIRRFTERCGGHPFVLRLVASAVRYQPGPLTEAGFERHLGEAATDVTEAVGRELATLSRRARDVLRVAAVLGPAPFSPTVATDVLGEDLDAAVEELVRGGLLRLAGDEWEVHALVSETVRAGGDLGAFAARAAVVVLEKEPGRLPFEHARWLGRTAGLPAELRIGLLHRVVEHHERQGDPLSAAHEAGEILTIERRVPDLLIAARLAIACGRPQEAEVHAREVLDLVVVTDDNRDRARLLLAQALDQLGRLDEADTAFWTATGTGPPAWTSGAERVRARLAVAAATLLRGHPRVALGIVEPLVRELEAAPAGPERAELLPVARTEYARLLQLTGKSRQARPIAEGVITHYRERGMPGHAQLLEAESVWADAFITLDLRELDGTKENWERSERTLRELAATYADRWGPDSHVALAARVRADRALLALGRGRDALVALAETEEEVVRHLGRGKEYFRVRHAMGMAHAQQHRFDRQRDIIRGYLDEQTSLLGRHHPETVESRLDLGIALALTNNRDEAVPLLDEAAQSLRSSLGFDVDLSGKATMSQWVLRMPYPMLIMLMRLGKLFE
jgi:tetratricopeptide (TPR) repeat protein